MVHRSYLSPDGQSVLLVEMGDDHEWTHCRVLPLDGSSSGAPVGPRGAACTSGAWSKDGKWMYVTSNAGGANHIWRQRFPDAEPEQVTSGPTSEHGVAMAPDGRSFITAAAMENMAIWIHDAKGERQISTLEGIAVNPKFTADGSKLFYAIVKELPTAFSAQQGEVWIADLQSGRSTPLAPGFQALNFDVSADGQHVVLAVVDSAGKPRLWVAPVDRGSPPRQIPNVVGRQPKFAPDGEIFFRHAEPNANRAYRVRMDGTGLRKALEQQILLLFGVSPDGQWLLGWSSLPNDSGLALQAFPLDGKPPVVIANDLGWTWSADGESLSLSAGPIAANRSYIVPLRRGEALPRIPAGGLRSEQDVIALAGARRIDAIAIPGPSPDVYAFSRGATQRNLYRVPVQ